MKNFMHNLLKVDDLMLAGPFLSSNIDGAGGWRNLAGVDNLLQAIWVRLNTAEGTLSNLGYPDYGSRLYLLIGELDTPETHDRARLYIARALSQEVRIAQILSIDIESEPAGTGRVLVASVSVRPIEHEGPLHFGFSILLEPAP